MICLRCGYCCQNLSVIIVDNPDLGTVEGNLIHHNGNRTNCKHLLGNKPGKYSCAIHHYDWYEETPCFAYTQIESKPNMPCRMGDYILNKLKTEKDNENQLA